eukprot:1144222-Pyramimonas_sp.AAC.1
MFERKATCRFDCAPPDLDMILLGAFCAFFQAYPDEKTKLVSKVSAKPPGGYRGIVRPLEPGEVIGPTVGSAVRYETPFGNYVSVPVVDHWTEGPPHVGVDIWAPSPRKPPQGSATGGRWGAMFALP